MSAIICTPHDPSLPNAKNPVSLNAVKPIPLLFTASLIANVAFVAVIATRPAAPSAPKSLPGTAARNGDSEAARKVEALRAALASGDAAALAAAGVSPDIARDLMIGRTFSRMAEKVRASQSKATADEKWWRSRPGFASAGSREQQLVARRELSDALIAAFGDDLGLGGADQSQLAFLPVEKRDALRRINQDYDEMMAKFSAGGVQLASDREKLRLLRIERERDIAALLTPEERLAYEMRTSISGNIVRSRYGDAIESEAEFQKIYALQKAFDEQYSREALSGRISPEVLRARSEAERRMDTEIRAAVGDERYAALRRAADPDVRTIDALASRLNLPSATTNNVLASRDSYSTASQRIANDASIPIPERRAQIQALAEQAKSELTRSLGSEGAEAYTQRSPWINMLQSGMAYSTTPPEGAPGLLLPGGGQSVYPVPPAGAVPPGGQRQVMFTAATPVDGAVIRDTYIGGTNTIMSFGVAGDPAAVPAGGGQRQTIVAPAPPASGSAPVNSNPAPANPVPRR
jgi:hypothetical protein